jgi:hypothetical protein
MSLSIKNSKGTPGTCVGWYYEIENDANVDETVESITTKCYNCVAQHAIIVSYAKHENFRKAIEGHKWWYTDKVSDDVWVHTLDYNLYNAVRTEFIKDAIARGRVKSLDEGRKTHDAFEVGDILIYRTASMANWGARTRLTVKREDLGKGFFDWERVEGTKQTGKGAYFGYDYLRVL